MDYILSHPGIQVQVEVSVQLIQLTTLRSTYLYPILHTIWTDVLKVNTEGGEPDRKTCRSVVKLFVGSPQFTPAYKFQKIINT